MTDDKNILPSFRAALKVLEIQRQLLSEANAEPGTLHALGAIIKHLNGLSEINVMKIISGRQRREILRKRKDHEAASTIDMTLDVVEQILADQTTTRSQLEAIAVGRFQVPRGSLRSLGNIDQLRDKIATLAQNERAHETISSVAKDTRA